MSHMDHEYSEKEQSHNSRSSNSIDGTTTPSRISNGLSNVLMGIRDLQNRRTHADHAAHSQLANAPICAYVGRLPCPHRGTANIGQMVRVIIPEEAVHLEAGALSAWQTTMEPMDWTGRACESEGGGSRHDRQAPLGKHHLKKRRSRAGNTRPVVGMGHGQYRGRPATSDACSPTSSHARR